MGGDTQGGLTRIIEEAIGTVTRTTGGRVRQVKLSSGGGVTVTLDDERYTKFTGEVSMFLEDPHAVADLNIALKTKLQDSEQEVGKVIQQLADARRREQEVEKKSKTSHENILALQNEVKNLRGVVSKGEDKKL